MEIKGKVALVTGANRGIGKAITIALLEKGVSKVYACARDLDSLSGLQTQFGESLVPVKLDVTNDDDIANLSSVAEDVDILINNAGVLLAEPLESSEFLGALESNLDVNLFGVIKVTRTLLPVIRSKESSAIAIVSSVAGLTNMPVVLGYSITKAAVHSFIQGLRSQLSDSSVLVSGIYPGPIKTDMTKGFDMEMASAEDTGREIVQGIENDDEYIFPDPMSRQAGALYLRSPQEYEKQFSKLS